MNKEQGGAFGVCGVCMFAHTMGGSNVAAASINECAALLAERAFGRRGVVLSISNMSTLSHKHAWTVCVGEPAGEDFNMIEVEVWEC